MIRPGDKLIVAVNSDKSASSTKLAKTAPTVETKGSKTKGSESVIIKHTVAKGESLAGIAQKYGVPQKDIADQNKLTSKSVLQVGQRLEIRKTAAGSPATSEDDEAVKTAKAPKEIVSAKAPQTAKAPVKDEQPSKAPVTETKEEKITYKVAAGDTPAKIAQKHGVPMNQLFKWNSWSKVPVLQIGAPVVVYKKK
jgi:LysM repeat protein